MSSHSSRRAFKKGKQVRKESVSAKENPIPVARELPVHTGEFPFCSANPKCPCHENQDAIEIISQYVKDGLMTPGEATRFVEGKTV
jgi:hypothetical protein